MGTTLAYAAAFLCSASFGLASVLEQIGTRRVKKIGSLKATGLLSLFRQFPYLAGLGLDGVGFVLFVVAAHALPLFFVQTVDTASILITAIAARYILKVHLVAKEYKLIALLVVGLLLLAYVSAPETATRVSPSFRYGLLAAVIPIAVLSLMGNRRRAGQPMLLAFLSGLNFSGLALISRIIPDTPRLSLLLDPLLYALAIYGLLGMLFFTMAIQAGSVTKVYTTTFVAETVIPALLGIVFLGDAPRKGMWVTMVVGFAITVASSIALASSKDYTHDNTEKKKHTQ